MRPHIDATYRTVETRDGRLLDGYSMGGGPLQAELIQAPRAGRQRAAEVLTRVYGGDQEYLISFSPRRLAEQNVEAII